MNVEALERIQEPNKFPVEPPSPLLDIPCPGYTAPQPPQSDPLNDPIRPEECSSLGLLELILKAPARLDRLIRDPVHQAELVPRLLGISLISFTFFGVAMSLVLSTSSVWPQLFPMEAVVAGRIDSPWRFASSTTTSLLSHWLNGDAFQLIAAYSIGLIAATGICLPSLYFYSLLAGVRMTMMDVVIQALKSKAVGAIALIGILPIYATGGLAIAIFPMPEAWRDSILLLGLVLPFIAGSAGTFSLYKGLSGFSDTIPAERRKHREYFLQRLVLSWAACYTVVSPVLIFTLWQRLQTAA